MHNDKQPLEKSLHCGSTKTILAWEPRPGPAAARNTGIELASGEILALLDADCAPDHGWLSAGVRFLTDYPDVGIGAGEIVRTVDLTTASAIELFDSVTYLQQRSYVERHRACVTANMFFRREVAISVGGFDETFSHNSYDDWDWVVRAVSAGFKIAFIDDSVVAHDRIDSMAALNVKARRMCRGQIAFDRKHGRWKEQNFSFIRAFLSISADRWERVRSDVRLTSYQKAKLFWPAVMASYWYTSEMGRILSEKSI